MMYRWCTNFSFVFFSFTCDHLFNGCMDSLWGDKEITWRASEGRKGFGFESWILFKKFSVFIFWESITTGHARKLLPVMFLNRHAFGEALLGEVSRRSIFLLREHAHHAWGWVIVGVPKISHADKREFITNRGLFLAFSEEQSSPQVERGGRPFWRWGTFIFRGNLSAGRERNRKVKVVFGVLVCCFWGSVMCVLIKGFGCCSRKKLNWIGTRWMRMMFPWKSNKFLWIITRDFQFMRKLMSWAPILGYGFGNYSLTIIFRCWESSD